MQALKQDQHEVLMVGFLFLLWLICFLFCFFAFTCVFLWANPTYFISVN